MLYCRFVTLTCNIAAKFRHDYLHRGHSLAYVGNTGCRKSTVCDGRPQFRNRLIKLASNRNRTLKFLHISGANVGDLGCPYSSHPACPMPFQKWGKAALLFHKVELSVHIILGYMLMLLKPVYAGRRKIAYQDGHEELNTVGLYL